MDIKFSKDIIEEINKRGSISIPIGYVTGEAYEEWLYEDPTINSQTEIILTKPNEKIKSMK